MSDLTVTVIESNEDWHELAPRWSALLEVSESASIFLTWEWLMAWADCCLGEDRTLFILAVKDEDNLDGIAPFYIEQKRCGPLPLRTVRFLGAPEAGSDYLDVFARRGREKAVANALYDFLMGEGKSRWDIVHLQNIPADALFLLYFNKRVQIDGKFAETTFCAYCPMVRCRTEDELNAKLSQSRKIKFRQDMRAIQREQEVVHSVINGQDVAGSLEEFFRLYKRTTRFSGKHLRPILDTFVARNNSDCPVQIDLLSVSGQAVAGLLHLKYRNTLAIYLMAVDKEFNPKISLGNLLVGLCLKNSIAMGNDAYDFLKGEESYKFHWATGGRCTLQFTLWQRNPAAVVSALGRLARHAGKLLLR